MGLIFPSQRFDFGPIDPDEGLLLPVAVIAVTSTNGLDMSTLNPGHYALELYIHFGDIC